MCVSPCDLVVCVCVCRISQSREEALEERMVEPRAAAGGSQDPVAGQARAPAAGAEQHPEAGRHPPGTEAPAQGDDAPGTSGRRAEEERAPLAALPSSGNQQQPHQPAGGASAGRAGAAGGGSTGRPRGSSKRTGAGAAAGEGAPGRVAHAAEGTSATGTADPPQQVSWCCINGITNTAYLLHGRID